MGREEATRDAGDYRQVRIVVNSEIGECWSWWCIVPRDGSSDGRASSDMESSWWYRRALMLMVLDWVVVVEVNKLGECWEM